MAPRKKSKPMWEAMEGYNKSGELLAYYVVRAVGEGEDLQLQFDSHGAYILLSAARETAEALNEMGKKADRFIRYYTGETLVELKKVRGKGGFTLAD